MSEITVVCLFLGMIDVCLAGVAIRAFYIRLPRSEWLLHPITWFVYLFLSTKSLRLFAFAFDLAPALVPIDGFVYLTHVFGTLFFIVFVVTHYHFTFRSRISIFSVSRRKWMRPIYAPKREYLALIILTGLFGFSLVYQIATGNFHSFGETREIAPSPIEILANVLQGTGVLTIGLGLFLYFRDRSWLSAGVILGIIGGMVVLAVLAGGRGALILCLIFLGIFAFSQPRLGRVVVAAIPVMLIVPIGILMTQLRSGAFYINAPTLSDYKYALEDAKGDITAGESSVVERVVDRFSYYPDTWAILAHMRWEGAGIPKGMYPYGSITDLYRLVPGFIWPGKPEMRFNFWTSVIVAGKVKPMDYPIGKIGEAYYVADFFGLVFAVFYGFAYHLCYRYLRMNPNVFVSSIYFLIMVRIMISGGANMMAMVDQVSKILYLIVPFFVVLSVFLKPEGRKTIFKERSAREAGGATVRSAGVGVRGNPALGR